MPSWERLCSLREPSSQAWYSSETHFTSMDDFALDRVQVKVALHAWHLIIFPMVLHSNNQGISSPTEDANQKHNNVTLPWQDLTCPCSSLCFPSPLLSGLSFVALVCTGSCPTACSGSSAPQRAGRFECHGQRPCYQLSLVDSNKVLYAQECS